MRFLEIFQLVGEVHVRVVGMPLLLLLLHLLRLHPHHLHPHLPGVVLGRVVVLLLFPGVVPQGLSLEYRTAISGFGVVRQVDPRDPIPWRGKLRERLVGLRPLRVP